RSWWMLPSEARRQYRRCAFDSGAIMAGGAMTRRATTSLPSRRVVLGSLLASALGGATSRATAQTSDYPSRPVTFIVPFAPGGVTSLFARILGQKLEQRLGKPFVVENRPARGAVTPPPPAPPPP